MAPVVTMRWGIWVWLISAAASAQPLRLNLNQAISRARAASPGVQVALRIVDEAEASRVGQGVIFPVNPRLFADYRPMAVELPGQPTDPRNGYNLGLDGLVEVSGAGGARATEAARRVEVAKSELLFEQTQAAAYAWLAYIDVLLAEQRVAQFAEAVEVQRRVEAGVRGRFDAGVAGEPEVATVAGEVASMRAQVLEASRQEVAARLALAQVLDIPPSTTLDVEPITLTPMPAPEEGPLVKQALERRPELKGVQARLALLEATDARLVREAFPKVGYNLGLDAAPASPVFGYLGLSVELPVAQRNQGPRAVAAAQLATERQRLEAQLRRVERDVALARRNYEARREQLEVLEREALPNARRTVELIEAGWRAGRFDVFRLTTAARDLVRVERERLETLHAVWTDYVELQRAAGGLNP